MDPNQIAEARMIAEGSPVAPHAPDAPTADTNSDPAADAAGDMVDEGSPVAPHAPDAPPADTSSDPAADAAGDMIDEGSPLAPAPDPQPDADPQPGHCPFCLRPAPADAAKCAHCAANIGDIRICPSCAEPVRETATICPFCRGDLLPPAFAEAGALFSEPWVIESSPLGGLITDQSVTALFYPPIMTITPTEIRIRRRMFLGLRTLDSKISVSRIASVRTVDGVVWGGLIIETYGGAAGDLSIGGLDKDEARQTATLIERLAEATPSSKSDRT